MVMQENQHDFALETCCKQELHAMNTIGLFASQVKIVCSSIMKCMDKMFFKKIMGPPFQT
jgi:hypothetical protein